MTAAVGVATLTETVVVDNGIEERFNLSPPMIGDDFEVHDRCVALQTQGMTDIYALDDDGSILTKSSDILRPLGVVNWVSMFVADRPCDAVDALRYCGYEVVR